MGLGKASEVNTDSIEVSIHLYKDSHLDSSSTNIFYLHLLLKTLTFIFIQQTVFIRYYSTTSVTKNLSLYLPSTNCLHLLYLSSSASSAFICLHLFSSALDNKNSLCLQ